MNGFIEVFLIGLVLSADSFSAALAMGFRPHEDKDTLKFALSSGSAEAFVAFLGAMAGATIVSQFDSIDHWISFILLLGVSLHMIYEALIELLGKEKKQESGSKDANFHSFYKILLVSFATSLDAFAVGVSLGASNKVLTPYLLSIGLWAFISTILGMWLGSHAPKKLGPIFNIFGASILIIMAFGQLH